MPNSVTYHGGYAPGRISDAEYRSSMPQSRHSQRIALPPATSTPNAHFGSPIGSPVSEHDAHAMAQVLRQHGYQVGTRPRRRRRKKRRKGFLVGCCEAIFGGSR